MDADFSGVVDVHFFELHSAKSGQSVDNKRAFESLVKASPEPFDGLHVLLLLVFGNAVMMVDSPHHKLMNLATVGSGHHFLVSRRNHPVQFRMDE
jgi:hypothetical protein